jgi:hypothetical protein
MYLKNDFISFSAPPCNYEDALLGAIRPQEIQTEAAFSRELDSQSELVVWDSDENVDEGNHEDNVEEHDYADDECKVGGW